VADVAQATMNHLGGSAGGSPGKVSLFNQQGLKATPGSFTQNTGAYNTATDNYHVPGIVTLLEFLPKCLPISETSACRFHY
jgi:hypothetical protein